MTVSDEFKASVRDRGIPVKVDNADVQKAIDHLLAWVENGCKGIEYTPSDLADASDIQGHDTAFAQLFKRHTDMKPGDYIEAVAGKVNDRIVVAVRKFLTHDQLHSVAGCKVGRVASRLGVDAKKLSEGFERATGIEFGDYIKERKRGRDPLLDWAPG